MDTFTEPPDESNIATDTAALRQEIDQLKKRLAEAETALSQSQRSRFNFPATSPELFHLLSLLSEYVYVIEITEDGHWHTIYLSPQFEALTGYPLDQLQAEWSLWSSKIINADDRATLSAQMMRITAGQGSETEYRLTRADNQVIWVRDRVNVQALGRPKLIYGIVSDITESKLRETSLAQLLEVSRALVATHNPKQVLDQAIKAVVKIVPTADRGSLQLLDEAGETLHTVVTSTLGEALGNTLIFRPGVGIAGHALGKNQVINVADTLSDKRFVFSDLPLRDRSLLVAPLIVKKRLVGTLSLSSESLNAFSSAHEALIQLIADQVASALENARLFEMQFRTEKELRRSERFLQSTIDALAIQLAILDEAGRIIALNAAWRLSHQVDYGPQSLDNSSPTLNLRDTDLGADPDVWVTISEGIRLVRVGAGRGGGGVGGGGG
ncbi:MAG: GAF domain-containing protein, partial [Chloroflexota bacterium]